MAFDLTTESGRQRALQEVEKDSNVPQYFANAVSDLRGKYSLEKYSDEELTGYLYNLWNTETNMGQAVRSGQDTSSAGAVGHIQLMPATFKEVYDKNNLGALGLPESRTDAQANVYAGTAYYFEMLERFGDPAKAAAAYNGGPGAILNGMLPETVDYVEKFNRNNAGAQELASLTIPGFRNTISALALSDKTMSFYQQAERGADMVVESYSGVTGKEAFTVQQAVMDAVANVRMSPDEASKLMSNGDAFAQERGMLPQSEQERLNAMSDDELKEYLKEHRSLIAQKDKTDPSGEKEIWYDMDKAYIGDETKALMRSVASSYMDLPEEEREKLRAKEEEKIDSYNQRAKEYANGANGAGENGMDMFEALILAMIAREMGYPELAAQILNGFGQNNGAGQGVGDGSGPGRGSGGRSGYYGDTDNGDYVPGQGVKPLNTGGLTVSPEDIASDEVLAQISAKTGIPVATLRERTQESATAINALHPDIKAAALDGLVKSWEAGKPVVLDSYHGAGGSADQFGFRGNGSFSGVNAKLAHIIEETARDFPLRVRVMSGKQGRGSGVHSHGDAVDITIYDQDGNALGNYQNAENFRAYELFAQAAYLKAKELYPELTDGRGEDLNWGGYFGDNGNGGYKYGSADLMDFRIEDNSKFRAGSIMAGLNGGHSFYDRGDLLGGSQPYSPEAFAAGIAQLETLRLTPEQAAHNRRTMFGVGKASGSLEAREDGYFNSRYLAFDIAPLDAQGKPMEVVDATSAKEIAALYAANGFTAESKGGDLTVHVGPDTKSYVGLSIIPGSTETVIGGLPAIPETWKHTSWAALTPELDGSGRPLTAQDVVMAKLPAEVMDVLSTLKIDADGNGQISPRESVVFATTDMTSITAILQKSGVTVQRDEAKETLKLHEALLEVAALEQARLAQEAAAEAEKKRVADAAAASEKKPVAEKKVADAEPKKSDVVDSTADAKADPTKGETVTPGAMPAPATPKPALTTAI